MKGLFLYRASILSGLIPLLKHHTEEVFGKTRERRQVRIMVTMPSEAAENYELMPDLLQRGMDCIRINCAHDTSVQWQAMIENLLPEIFEQVKIGATVWIDDGKIGATVESIAPQKLVLRVTHARPKGEQLRPDSGCRAIN